MNNVLTSKSEAKPIMEALRHGFRIAPSVALIALRQMKFMTSEQTIKYTGRIPIGRTRKSKQSTG
jgi:hypothetical protein